MSQFNPVPFFRGAQQASKEYAENRSLDDILRQSKQAKSISEHDDIMSQVLQRLPPEKQEAAMQFIQQKKNQLQKNQLYQSVGLGGDSQPSIQSVQQTGSPGSQGNSNVQQTPVPFARAKVAAIEGNAPLARVLADEEKLNIKQQNELRKEAEPKLLEHEESLANLKNQDMKFNRLNTLFSPELESKFPPRTLAAAFTKNGELSALGQSLLSDEAQEAVKLITDEIKGAKDTFGARVSNFEAGKYLQTLPSLINSPEGRRRVLRDLRMVNNINRMEKEGILEVMDRYGGPGSISLSKATSIFRKEFEPRRKELAEEFANPGKKLFKEIPEASMYAGKRFQDEETGQIFKSDGKSWIPQGEQ